MKGVFELRPEQWVLFGAFIFLGVVGIVKALMLPDIATGSTDGHIKNPDKYDTSKISAILERWNKPPIVNATEHKVYVSRLIVFKPDTQEIIPLADEGMIKGMTVGWMKQYKLSLEDPNVAISDPDQDGFNNKEEFDAKTDPIDGESHPDFIQKLCLKDYEFIPFIMEFKGYNPKPDGDGLIYQIKLPEVRGRNTKMVAEGADLKGYTIGEFRKKIVDKYNDKTGITEKIDISELDVIDPALNIPVTLVFNERIESDESKVGFELAVPGLSPEPATLRRGGIFKIKDVAYQLISASPASAVVREVETGKEFTIPQCGQ